MIKFRQKEFVGPLVAAAGRMLPELAVSAGIGMAGNKAQQKANEEQTEIIEKQAREQKKQNERMAEAMNKIAENSKNNPQVAQQAASQVSQVMMSQREFARIGLGGIGKAVKNSKFLKNAKGLGKDLWTITKENKTELIGGTLAGGAMAGAGYLTDRAIQADMKKSGIPLQKQEQRSYAAIGSIMGGLKKAGKTIWEAAKKRKGMIAGMAVLGSAPTALGYIAEKQQLKDQLGHTQQKTYSLKLKTFGKFGFIGKAAKGLAGKVKGVKNWQIWKTPGQTTLGFLSNMSMGGGRKGVSGFGKRLEELGEKSGSEWSKKAGRFIQTHPKTALAASIPVGMGIMSATWDTGDKLVRKGAEAVDKNAYAYQKSKEEQIR